MIWKKERKKEKNKDRTNSNSKTWRPRERSWINTLVLKDAQGHLTTATHSNTLQHTTTHCNTLHHSYWKMPRVKWRLQNTTTCYNALQHAATFCNALHHSGKPESHDKYDTKSSCVPWQCKMLQHVATHCNTLQRLATRCNILWRSASLRKTRVTWQVCHEVFLCHELFLCTSIQGGEDP